MTYKNYISSIAATLLVATSLLGASNVLAKNDNTNKNDKVFKHVASLSISDNSFTWVGPPALSHYTVSFCDGETTGKIDIDANSEVTTLSFDKQISQVIGKGGQQFETVNASCDSEPEEPQDEPEDEPNDEPNDNGGGSENTGGGSVASAEEVLGASTLAFTGTDYFRVIAFSVFSLLLLVLFLMKLRFPKRKATVYHENI